jgi:hypothetical protein
MKTRTLLLVVGVAMVAAIVPQLAAQAPAAKRVVSSQPALTAAQALPLTCAQAWVASEKDYAKLRTLVVTLAKVSLVNRDLTFPNQRDAGVNAGKGIAADCKADPDALLFAIVDKHVRQIAGVTPR